MNLRTLVWRELRERPGAMLTSTIAILLGVTALVAIRHVTVFSEAAIGKKLESLGANLLVLPKDASLQDYYAADLSGKTLPESHVASILLANLAGVERLSPRLCTVTKVAGREVTFTGILPQKEFAQKAIWKSVGLFSNKHQGCKKADHGPKNYDSAPETLASSRSIDQLQGNEAVIGADIAEFAKLKVGSKITLLDDQFEVLAVLPRTGTIDDTRVFAHLHTVQRLTKAGEVVNAIEVMGCCQDAAGGLVPSLAKLLPDAKVVTISQVVQTQVGVNKLMSQMSWFVFGMLIVIGGASVASTISANVRERRREVGTLLALGATPRLISRIFLLKALILGVTGAVGGCLLGVIIAMVLGAFWAGVSVTPLPGLLALAATAALAITLLAALWPARSAARLDPCLCFQEV
ncbi:ABC transporter permease [Anatilimnocola floriformis]|uniref:ABC transporter permease n=1 Tax=Anatilimnocola floriformis TaxID=2948575 RepID=UPI0020C28B56|nr:FtsX-like permease family protein [Anatilimnocola floriformis]